MNFGLRKGHLKMETEYILMALQRHKNKLNNGQIRQNTGNKLYKDRDETINSIICEFSKPRKRIKQKRMGKKGDPFGL